MASALFWANSASTRNNALSAASALSLQLGDRDLHAP